MISRNRNLMGHSANPGGVTLSFIPHFEGRGSWFWGGGSLLQVEVPVPLNPFWSTGTAEPDFETRGSAGVHEDLDRSKYRRIENTKTAATSGNTGRE